MTPVATHQTLQASGSEPSSCAVQRFSRLLLIGLVVAQLAGAAGIFAVGEAHAHHPEISIITLR